MSRYPRTEEGFAKAYKDIKTVAKLHPNKEYCLFVDRRYPTEYSISLAGLVHSEHVENGTLAIIVDGNGNFRRMIF